MSGLLGVALGVALLEGKKILSKTDSTLEIVQWGGGQKGDSYFELYIYRHVYGIYI
jgi:hypothetical protein